MAPPKFNAMNLNQMAEALNKAMEDPMGGHWPPPGVAQARAPPQPALHPGVLEPSGSAPPEGIPNPLLPPLPVTDPRNAGQWEVASVNTYKKAQKGTNKGQAKKDWMATESMWKNRVGKNWKPVKILGKGGQGIVGHWTYDGPDRHLRALNDVAVKQAVKAGPHHTWGDGLETEARLLSLFQPIKTQHVVKMYCHKYEDVGQKTDRFDYGLVHRMVLEFCPGGDLNNWLGTYMNKPGPKNVPEYEIWCLFHCLAKALLVVHSGSEDPKQARWDVKEIAHLDLKLENVLVGDIVTDTEHRNRPSFKISDFGLAKEVPSIQTKAYLKLHSRAGTVAWYLPEQVQDFDHPAISKYYPAERPWLGKYFGFMQNAVKDPRLGTASNVWQIGMILYVIMRSSKHRIPNWGGNGYHHHDCTKLMCYQSRMTPRLQTGGSTIGCSLDIAAEQNPKDSMYSKELRSLIAECLLVSPASRVPPAELVERTGKNLNALNMAKGVNPGELEAYEEPPQLSQLWYSGQLNGDPANAAPVPVPDLAANPFGPDGKAQVAVPKPATQSVGTNAQDNPPLNPGNPAPGPRTGPVAAGGVAPMVFNAAAQVFVPQTPVISAPAADTRISSGVDVALPTADPAQPGPNPDAADGLYPISDPLNVIVLHRPGLLRYGGMTHVTYKLTGLKSTDTVQDVVQQLFSLGVKPPFSLKHGRKAMLAMMKLGEFKNLQNIRATET